jgi:hypothetical protein
VTGPREYVSLDEALVKFGIPWENHDLIRKIAAGIPLSRFVETSSYIRADRTDGGPSLNIASGWTNGFRSESEILDILGDVDRWGDDTRARLWGVSHPVNHIGHGGGGPAGVNSSRDYGDCPNCFMKLAASGVCDECGFAAAIP